MSLRLEGIWKSYGARPVLRGVDLEVGPEEIYCLLGPNGSGKSTALQIVAGLLAADRGQVLRESRRISNTPRSQLGFVPQEPALYPSLSCVETLRFFGGVYGVPRQDLKGRVEAVIGSAGLEPYREVRVETLSGGWRQRLSLAASLVHEPTLLVLDEPTTGLDVEVRGEIWWLISSLAHEGKSVFLSSHNLQEIEAHCHRVGILREGRVAAQGSPEELRHLVPAVEIAEIEVDDEPGLLAKCREAGWRLKERRGRWLLFLQTHTTLPELAQELANLSLRSLSLRPVTLEDAFLEVTSKPTARV